jgi:hypothetical protein
MSEERRKRQLEREGIRANPAETKKYVIRGLVVLLFVIAFYGGWYYKNHKYDKFAQCLATKQALMYGLYWCPHCIEQKEKFGESFRYVPYVECSIKGSNDMAPGCKMAGVKLFPSWQFDNEPPKEGVLSLEALSDKTGCSLP